MPASRRTRQRRPTLLRDRRFVLAMAVQCMMLHAVQGFLLGKPRPFAASSSAWIRSLSSASVGTGATAPVASSDRGLQDLTGLTDRHNLGRRCRALRFSTRNNLHIDIVSSTKSNTVKRIQALLRKRRKRTEHQMTVVEGPRMVFDLLDNPQTSRLVRSVLVLEDAPYRERLRDSSLRTSLHVQVGTSEVLRACSDTMTPQGILAVVDIPDPQVRPSPDPLYLVLDGVGDPGNLGTLIRSSMAVGVTAIVLMPGSCDVWNPKALRSSMGAAFQVPIIETDGWDSTVALLKDRNVGSIYAATMITDERAGQPSRAYYDVDWLSGPTALVIGSEGNGLCTDIRNNLAANGPNSTLHAVHVPMNDGIESLNAAVCGSVILFEYARQLSMATDLR